MYTSNLVSILFYDQPLSIFKFDDVMPTSRIHSDAAETGFYTQWWTVSSMLALLAPEYVAHHTDAIHQWVTYLHYLRNYVF